MKKGITTASAVGSLAQNLQKTTTCASLLTCVPRIVAGALMSATAHRDRHTAPVLRVWNLNRIGKLARMLMSVKL